jgi:hypothetical protein
LDEEFNENEFLHDKMLNSEDMTDLLIQINESVSMVDTQIRKDLRQNMDGLIHHSLRIKQVQANFGKILDESRSLKSKYDSLRSQILSPIQELREVTNELELLEEAMELIRNCHRTFQLIEKANEFRVLRQKSPSEEKDLFEESITSLPKIAQLLTEAKSMIVSHRLGEITLIKSGVSKLKAFEEQISHDAFNLLMAAIRSNNQPEIGAALQVSFNLQNLPEFVERAVNILLDDVSTALKESLDVSTLLGSRDRRGSGDKVLEKGKPGVAVSSNQAPNASWRSSLWLSVERFFDRALLIALQVHSLERVLFRKVDPSTDSPFFLSLPKNQSLGEIAGPFWDFWGKFLRLIDSEFISSSRKSTFLRKIFTAEYSRLETSLSDFFLRLSKQMEDSARREEVVLKETFVLTDKHHRQLLSSISTFANNKP